VDVSAPSPSNDPISAHPGRSLLPIPVCLILSLIVILLFSGKTIASELRRTALVRAVADARDAIVNIRGQKIINQPNHAAGNSENTKRVNGMGTGVIIDPRGYIVTNFHVIDGVSTINVNLSNGDHYVAQTVSHDPKTDLAIVKIDPHSNRLPTIRIGTSRDLMPGETVIAVGNAYGYEHTVTRGIISALDRTVQVSDVQYYYDLIQTDASINPGNSGGPLLNIDGELIGINVAVRVGAQGIGFALPVDKVLDVSANLLSVRQIEKRNHGIRTRPTAESSDGLVVASVEAGTAGQRAGLRPGDRIRTVKKREIRNSLDLETALLGQKGNEEIPIEIVRNGKLIDLDLIMPSSGTRVASVADPTWVTLGLKLEALNATQLREKKSRYRGGLSITAVRDGSPADEQGIRTGDILVGMHIWETVSMENVAYVLKQEQLSRDGPIKFYILRGNQTLFGHIHLASEHRRATQR